MRRAEFLDQPGVVELAQCLGGVTSGGGNKGKGGGKPPKGEGLGGGNAGGKSGGDAGDRCLSGQV